MVQDRFLNDAFKTEQLTRFLYMRRLVLLEQLMQRDEKKNDAGRDQQRRERNVPLRGDRASQQASNNDGDSRDHE